MTTAHPQRPVTGIFWMVVTGLCFICVTALVKHMGPRLPSSEAAFIRYGFGLVFLLPAIGALREAKLRSMLAIGQAPDGQTAPPRYGLRLAVLR